MIRLIYGLMRRSLLLLRGPLPIIISLEGKKSQGLGFVVSVIVKEALGFLSS